MSNLEGILDALEKLKIKYAIEKNYDKDAKVRELIIKIKQKIYEANRKEFDR